MSKLEFLRRSLPLSLRLPNPPPVWVGRQSEVDALVQALERGPLVMVWGPSGIGKTALVQRTLHTRFPDRVPRTLVLRLAPEATLEQTLSSLVSALVGIHQLTMDLKPLVSNRESLVATALDLAELEVEGDAQSAVAGGFWIVLDDVQHLPLADLEALLAALAQHATRSRWIAIGRQRLELDVALGQSLAVTGFDEPDLERMASAWFPGVDHDPELLARAGGSPWRLLRLLSGSALEAGDDPLADVAENARPLLRLLSMIELPLGAAVVQRLHAPVDIDALVHQGLLERGPAGVRIHDSQRSLMRAGLSGSDASRLETKAAELLAGESEPFGWLEALRLFLHGNDIPSAQKLLERHLSALIEQGYEAHLWRLLEGLSDPNLAAARIEIAVELADPKSVPKLALPAAPSHQDRLRWAKLLRIAGRFDEALETVDSLVEDANTQGDAQVAFFANILRANLALDRHQAQSARELLESLAPTTPLESVERDILLAVALGQCGEHGDSVALAKRIEPRLADLEDRSGDLRRGLGWVLYSAGAIRRARDVVRPLLAEKRAARLHGLGPARLLFLALGASLDCGELTETSVFLGRLRKMSGSAFQRAFTHFLEVQQLLAQGYLEEAREVCGSVEGPAKEYQRFDLLAAVCAARCRIALGMGEPPSAELAPSGSSSSEHDDLHRLHYYALRGAWALEDTPPALSEPAHPEVAATAAYVSAFRDLTRGDPHAAVEAARRARALARNTDYRLIEHAALVTQVESELISDLDQATLSRSVGELESLARAMDLELGVQLGELMRCGGALGNVDPLGLERLAQSPFPSVRRRALALLGDEVQLSPYEELVVAAHRRRCGIHVEIANCSRSKDRSANLIPAGMDPRSAELWFAGKVTNLRSRQLLWRLLELLADSDEPLSKEELIVRAWELDAYHPLRHDARLHTAVSAIRKAIGSQHTIVQSTAEGYRIAENVLLRRLVPTR
ncbi:MAG: AAA family ATPase [Polyangiaceae bacterium]